ncbi:MAG TPA: Calx-beta domain-containing protein [Xanthobacteraceae bacterium]|nr:Calx-beta domain-containing protein [Xanthobacteraceae bacterium]
MRAIIFAALALVCWTPAAAQAVPRAIIDEVIVTEGKVAAGTLRIDGDNGQPISICFGTSPDTAKATEDYLARSGCWTINPGSVRTRSWSVPTVDNQVVEPDERFIVRLTCKVNVTCETPYANVTIVDNDAPAPTGWIVTPLRSGLATHARAKATCTSMWNQSPTQTVKRAGVAAGSIYKLITAGPATAPGKGTTAAWGHSGPFKNVEGDIGDMWTVENPAGGQAITVAERCIEGVKLAP